MVYAMDNYIKTFVFGLVLSGIVNQAVMDVGLISQDPIDQVVPRAPTTLNDSTSYSIGTLTFVANNTSGDEVAVYPPADELSSIIQEGLRRNGRLYNVRPGTIIGMTGGYHPRFLTSA